FHEVGDQFRRGIVQRVFYRVDDDVHRSGNRLADFDGTDFDTGGQSGDEVAPTDVTHALLRTGISRADFNFDFFRLSFTDEQVVFGAHVLHHVLVHLVTCYPDRTADDDSTERKDGDLCSAAADVYDHASPCLLHGKPRANCGGDRLLDELALTCARAHRRVIDGTFFHFGDTARNPNHRTRTRERNPRLLVRLADQMVQHGFSHVELADHAVAYWTDDQDFTGILSPHFFRTCAHFQRAACFLFKCNERRFVDNNTLAAHTDEGIGCSQIDANVQREQAKKIIERT